MQVIKCLGPKNWSEYGN